MNKSISSQDILDRPRQTAQMLVFLTFAIWLTLPALLGFFLFITIVKILKIKWQPIVVASLIMLMAVLLSQFHLHHQIDIKDSIQNGFNWNVACWRCLLRNDRAAFKHLLLEGHNYLMAVSIVMAGMLAMLELISNSSHESQLRAVKSGRLHKNEEKNKLYISHTLAKLNDNDYDGTLLGISKVSAKAIVAPDHLVNQLVMVLGTTGAGKTITLRRFFTRAVLKNYPLIIVDGKPTEDNTPWIESLAKKYGKPFYGFHCGNFSHYNCLSDGGYTELKDKIISLKDEWENDYYRSIAEDYLQTTFEVLLATQQPFDLKRVVECLDYDELVLLVRNSHNTHLETRVKRLANYERKDITGLQAHLNLLVHSEFGDYFENAPGNTFTLSEVIANNGVVYFALPALSFPSFSKVLGKLIINDIKTIINKNHANKRIFTVFDEFSVFAGDQVLNLVNMGRGKGIHAVFGTQGLSDLKSISPEFANQVLNCINTLICHRVNDADSAESISKWAGTHDVFDVTAQVDINKGTSGVGSVRCNKEFLVHPDEIKQNLGIGEAYYMSKVGQFKPEKIVVKFT